MIQQRPAISTNNAQKELTVHGTSAFPCAGFEYPITDAPEDAVSWHWHEEIEIIYVVRGTMRLQVLSDRISLHEGEVAVINGNALHAAMGEPYCDHRSLVFSPLLITGSPDSVFAVRYITPMSKSGRFSCMILGLDNPQIARWYMAAFEALKADAFGYEFTVRDQLTRILLAVYQKLEPGALASDAPQNEDALRMARMLDFIRENFNQNITLSGIAGSSGISEREALRCFKRTIGESPIQYLVKYRLMRSADMLLAQPAESVSAIAGNCGFDSPAYYTKKFKELYQFTPREYRHRLDLRIKSEHKIQNLYS